MPDRLFVDTRSPLVGLTFYHASQTTLLEITNGLPSTLTQPSAHPTHSRLTTNLAGMARPLRSSPITGLHHYYEPVRPCASQRYSSLAVSAARTSPVTSDHRL